MLDVARNALLWDEVMRAGYTPHSFAQRWSCWENPMDRRVDGKHDLVPHDPTKGGIA